MKNASCNGHQVFRFVNTESHVNDRSVDVGVLARALDVALGEGSGARTPAIARGAVDGLAGIASALDHQGFVARERGSRPARCAGWPDRAPD
jgi:hypothetical protein